MAAGPPRAVVYLGASSPVHATHTRLVRALLDEFDVVFVFLLTWTPDRAGTSASAGAAQLRKWLAALPAAEQARVHLDVVEGEGEGAKKMRTALGSSGDPAVVEVCFSQKYKDQTERIESNWLPLYRDEFPQATARFLRDEIDPGAAAFGTPQFVEAVQRYRVAKGTSDEAAEATALDAWRPEQETADGWSAYVDGLLSGAQGDPFYTPAQLATLQAAFFSDAEVLRLLDGTARATEVPGGALSEYLREPQNVGRFWKKMAVPSDHALFKRHCLRAQGVEVDGSCCLL